MTFLSLGFLLAGLAAAIPILLHMINRRKAKELPFSTLRFLRVSVEKTRRRRRLQDLLLLLLRMAVLILIAIGLARPTVTNLSNLWGGGDSAIAIVLDNSMSMAVIDSGRPRFETALGAAMQILDQLESGDQVALFLPCGPRFPEEGRLSRSPRQPRAMLESEPPTTANGSSNNSDSNTNEAPADASETDTQAMVRQLLTQVTVTHEKADLAAKVREARELLGKSNAVNKQIYVLTDMQKLGWDSMAPAADASESKTEGGVESTSEQDSNKIPVIFVNCSRQAKPNVALTDVQVTMTVPIAGAAVGAVAELYNASDVPQQRHLEVLVNGLSRYTSPSLQIEPGSRLKHTFQVMIETGGLHRCETRLVGDDGCPQDDRRFFAVEVDQGIPIAIAKPRRHEIAYLDESYYVEQALAPATDSGWAIRATQLTVDELASEPLSSFSVVYCVNLPAPDEATAERLARYVEGGGHIVWLSGDNVDPAAYNTMNAAAGGRLLPSPLIEARRPSADEGRDTWYIASLDGSHAALADLTEPVSLIQSVLVYQYIAADAAASPGAAILARLDDGEPILMRKRVGQGSVTLLGTSAHVGWTNLPVRPVFLPLLVRLTLDLAGAERTRHQTVAGEPLVLALDHAARPAAIEITPPSGSLTRRNLDDGARDVFVYADTREVGVYTLRPLQTARAQAIAYAVNFDADEVDPLNITREELTTLFGTTPLVFTDDPEDLSPAFDWLRRGRGLWHWFITGVLFVLVFECFMSNYLSPREDDVRPRELSPAMRGLVRRGRS